MTTYREMVAVFLTTGSRALAGAVAGLSVTIGRYWYLFKRLTAVSAGRFYRFEHIVAYSSGKVVAKSDPSYREIVKETLGCHYS